MGFDLIVQLDQKTDELRASCGFDRKTKENCCGFGFKWKKVKYKKK